MQPMKIAVLGNGAWGAALASAARRRGNDVALWGRKLLNPTPKEVLKNAEIIILAVPSHAMREVCGQFRPLIPRNSILVSVAKGIEQDSHLRMTQIIRKVTGHPAVAVLSGPSFASEVQRGLPTAVVCAAGRAIHAKKIQAAFNNDDFRVYTQSDVVGVELGGALKNVMAIGAGACVGLGLGENAIAALITRGLAELSRIGMALGGRRETFFGLSGVGDLILTCSSDESRNRRLGERLALGERLEDILATLGGTAEGVKTARSVHQLLQKHKMEGPIVTEIYLALYEQKPLAEAVKALMGREPKKEF